MTENLPSLMPSNSDFQVLQMIADNASKSGLYAGVGSQQKILMVLMTARELGIPPMQALNGGIHNIQGKVEISARLMCSMIRRAGHNINIIQCDSKVCVLEGKRKDNGDTFKAQFTIEDAAKAGLSSRDVWKKYTEDMLYSRALSRLARRLFADVIGTSYIEGEISLAEVDIIDTGLKDDAPIPEIEIDPMPKLLELCPREDHAMIIQYIDMLADTYKQKTKVQLIHNCIEKFEKFQENFNTWKINQLAEGK